MKTVLVIEDDPLDVIIILEVLKGIKPKVNVHVERNGVDAVLYLKGEAKFADREKYPFPATVLLDLNLPQFDGFEFLKWLRKGPPRHRQLPVVVISGTNRPEDLAQVRELGANAVIIKTADWPRFKKDLTGVKRFWSEKTC